MYVCGLLNMSEVNLNTTNAAVKFALEFVVFTNLNLFFSQ